LGSDNCEVNSFVGIPRLGSGFRTEQQHCFETDNPLQVACRMGIGLVALRVDSLFFVLPYCQPKSSRRRLQHVASMKNLLQPFESRSSSKQYLRIQFLLQRKQYVSMTTINWLMLFREIIAVYSENHTKPTNTLYGQNTELVNIKAGCTCGCHYGKEQRIIRIVKCRRIRLA
jgi:hypothetical protein